MECQTSQLATEDYRKKREKEENRRDNGKVIKFSYRGYNERKLCPGEFVKIKGKFSKTISKTDGFYSIFDMGFFDNLYYIKIID